MPIGDRHACAVCDKQIGTAYLMCMQHWKLVPREQQQEVYRTWARYRNADGGLGQIHRVQRLYYAARDAAIASAHAAQRHPSTPTNPTGDS